MSKRIDFWKWFLSKSEYIYHNLESDTDNIAFDIANELKKVHEDLEFEIPFDKEDDLRTFIISADGVEEIFEEVTKLVNLSPNIDGWNIIAFRPRLHQKNQIIDLDGITMDYHDVFFQFNVEDNQIVIDVYIKNFDGVDNRYVHLYFLLLDSLIGEYDSVTKIKETRIYPLKDTTGLYEFPRLIEFIDRIK